MRIVSRTNVQCWRLFPVGPRTSVKDELAFRSATEAEFAASPESLGARLTFVELVTVAAQNPLLFGNDFTFDRLTAAQREWFQVLNGRVGLAALHATGFQNIGGAWDTLESRPFVESRARRVATAVPEVSQEGSAEGLKQSTGTSVPPVTVEAVSAQELREEAVREDTQEDFLNLVRDSSCVVLAPPGTGKTEVLVKALRQIILAGDISSPGDEVVVLTFSRAAVGVLRSRLGDAAAREQNEDIRYIRVRTFDSFVTELLRRDCDAEFLRRKNYDQRIEYFENAVDSMPGCAEAVGAIRYLFVDEIQDLVGVRADLTLLLARRVLRNGGIAAMLGDPAQAIYDWQVRDSPEATTSVAFLKQAEQIVNYQVLRFRKSYRYSGDQMERLSVELRDALGDGFAPDSVRVVSALSQLPKRMLSAGELKNLAGSEERTAILTRDNLEAWQIASWMRANQVPAELWRGTRGGAWPRWLAVVLRGWKMKDMTADRFVDRWEKRGCSKNEISSDDALEMLRGLGVLEDGMLDIELLRHRMLTQSAPNAIGVSGIVVSTIHRAKGLEFDNVLILDPPSSRWQGEPESIRVLYVAATRAMRSLALLSRDPSILRRGMKLKGGHFNLYAPPDRMNRLLLDGAEEATWQVGEDFDFEAEEAAHDMLSALEDGRSVSFVKAGQAYQLVLDGDAGTIPVPRWASRALARDLVTLERKFGAGRPVIELRGVTCAGVASIALDDEDMRSVVDSVGVAGLGLVPIFSGLGEVIFGQEPR